MPGLVLVTLLIAGSVLAVGIVLSRFSRARVLRSLATEPAATIAGEPASSDAFDAPSRIVTIEDLERLDEPIERAG